MQTVNVRQARAQISQLLDAVEAGEEIIIQRNGKPVARLMPIKSSETMVHFPDRSAFRQRLPLSREDSVNLVRRLRENERF